MLSFFCLKVLRNGPPSQIQQFLNYEMLHLMPRMHTVKRGVHGARLYSFNGLCTMRTRRYSTSPAASELGIQGIKASVFLKEGKASLFHGGNPILYDKAVARIEGEPEVGEEVLVLDHKGKPVGRGFYNDQSMYRVRILAKASEPEFLQPLRELLLTRFRQAAALRRALGLREASTTNALECDNTSMYRLVNGEGDRLGGLVVDVLGPVAVTQSGAGWCERHRQAIEYALIEVESDATGGATTLLWKQAHQRLRADGYHVEKIEEEYPYVMDEEQEDLILQENGHMFSVNAIGGQKTGFYCDQRENRKIISKLARGKTMLDLYCYTGGFTVNAMVGGATSCVSVDSSAEAIIGAATNLRLNSINEDLVELVNADVSAHMRHLLNEKRTFDIVICDPPKLAPSRKSMGKAYLAYMKINTMAMQLVSPGGILLTCSCSQSMSARPDTFHKVIATSASNAHKDVRVLNTFGPASDHPVHIGYPEGRYFKGMLLHVQ